MIPTAIRKLLYDIARGEPLRHIANVNGITVREVQAAAKTYKVPHNCGMLDEEVDQRIMEYQANPKPPRPRKQQEAPAEAEVITLEPDPEVQQHLATLRDAAAEAQMLQTRVREVIHNGLITILEEALKNPPEVKDMGDLERLVRMVSGNIGLTSKGGKSNSEGLDLNVINMRPVKRVGA